jgi:hypothetical protein
MSFEDVYLLPDGETLNGYGYDVQLTAAPLDIDPGQSVTRSWNTAVIGPNVAIPRPIFPVGTRPGDSIWVDLPMFADAPAGHVGYSRTDTARIALARDGQTLGEQPFLSGEFGVPNADGTYRLRAEATRSVSALSTKVSAEWTFRSGHVDSCR